MITDRKADRWPGGVILPASVFDYARSMGIDMLRYRRQEPIPIWPSIPTNGEDHPDDPDEWRDYCDDPCWPDEVEPGKAAFHG